MPVRVPTQPPGLWDRQHFGFLMREQGVDILQHGLTVFLRELVASSTVVLERARIVCNKLNSTG